MHTTTLQPLAEGTVLRAPDGRIFELADYFDDGYWGCNIYSPDDFAAMVPMEWREVRPEDLAEYTPCRRPREGDTYMTADGHFRVRVTGVGFGHITGLLWSEEAGAEEPRPVSLFDLMDMVLVGERAVH